MVRAVAKFYGFNLACCAWKWQACGCCFVVRDKGVHSQATLATFIITRTTHTRTTPAITPVLRSNHGPSAESSPNLEHSRVRVHESARVAANMGMGGCRHRLRSRALRRTSEGSGASELRGVQVGVARRCPHSRTRSFCSSEASGAVCVLRDGTETLYE